MTTPVSRQGGYFGWVTKLLKAVPTNTFQGPLKKKGGEFQTGGFPIWTCPSLFWSFFASFFASFPIFLGFSPELLGDGPGIFPICPFPLSRPIKSTYEEKSPERVRDTIWTFPNKTGKPPGLETPWFSFSQLSRDTFSAIPAIPQQGAIPTLSIFFDTDISVRYPILQHIARYLCDTSWGRFLAERIFSGFLFLSRRIFFADFLAGFFLLIFVGKSAQKNPPGKSPAKSS